MTKPVWLYVWLLFALGSLIAPTQVLAQDESPTALLLTAEGAVTPVMAEYLSRGITKAERDGAEVLVFQLDTPGGSVDVMNRMVKDIRASTVPVVVYVAPRGRWPAAPVR